MAKDSMSIECSACGAPITEKNANPKDPCPYCGCTRKLVRLGHTDTVSVHDRYRFKAKNPGTHKKVFWSKGGDDLQRDTGRWMTLSRTFDKREDWYTETLIDKETGEIVKHVEEPLTQHIGHGAAKKTNNTNKK